MTLACAESNRSEVMLVQDGRLRNTLLLLCGFSRRIEGIINLHRTVAVAVKIGHRALGT
jgi:hypothetical protein